MKRKSIIKPNPKNLVNSRKHKKTETKKQEKVATLKDKITSRKY